MSWRCVCASVMLAGASRSMPMRHSPENLADFRLPLPEVSYSQRMRVGTLVLGLFAVASVGGCTGASGAIDPGTSSSGSGGKLGAGGSGACPAELASAPRLRHHQMFRA